VTGEAAGHRPKRNARPARALLHLAVAAFLWGTTFAIYVQVRHHDFVSYDDPIYILENPSLQVGLSLDTVTRAFTEAYETNWIPLTWISLQIDHVFFGFEPAGYHLMNVALHALSAVLLYLVLARMTGSPWPSAFVAAVFAVHPLHVESVAWAAERKDPLSGVFWMLTIAAYASYAARPRSLARYVLVAACFSLGLLAKPMLVSLPLVLVLLDYWPLGRLRREGSGGLPDPAQLRRILLEKLPLLAIAAAVSAVTIAVQREAGAMSDEDMMPFPLRLMNALDSYVIYVFDSFWPDGLAFFYPHPMTTSSPWLAGASALALAGATLLFARLVASRPYLLVGWLWYLGALLPVIGLVQVGMQARADRYMYLPQIGLTIALAWGARDALAPSRAGRVALAIAGAAAVAALSLCTWRQLPHWRDTTALYTRAIEVTEDNFLAHGGLAGKLLEAGHPEEAEHHFARAIELKPRWPEAHIGLADALLEQERTDAAIESYRRALRVAPRHALGHVHLGKALEKSGKLARAIYHFRRALELSGDDPTPEMHAYLAAALAKKKNLVKAEEHFERAIALRPGFGEAHANLGFVLIRKERYAEARWHLERALGLMEESPEIHVGLATAAGYVGDPRAAIGHYRAALRLRPGWKQPANNLAWLLATHPDPDLRDPEDAIRIAEALGGAESAPGPAVLDTLAAAYAAAGRFDAARRTAEVAERLAREQGMDALAGEIGQRLALYRVERPFIDTTATVGR
jgi:Flp pilus assembly protein TadD